MTLFTNGYITLPIPKGFQSINSTEEFVELVLVDPTKPMTIKVSVTPTLAGLVDIKESIEKNFENGNGELIFSDFLPINEDIYRTRLFVVYKFLFLFLLAVHRQQKLVVVACVYHTVVYEIHRLYRVHV